MKCFCKNNYFFVILQTQTNKGDEKGIMNVLDKFRYCPICGSQQFKVNSSKSKKCEKCGFELFMNASSAVAAFITNSKGELLVERRKLEPAKGTLDLPGGFVDPQETAEEAIRREVLEETNLMVDYVHYIFSIPNIYRFSGLDIPTLDLFFNCKVEDETTLKAMDDAAECLWLAPDDIHTEHFGLRSVRQALRMWMRTYKK